MKNYQICKSYETSDTHLHEFFMVVSHYYGKSGFLVRYIEQGRKVCIEIPNRGVFVKAGFPTDISYNRKKLEEHFSLAEAKAIAEAVKEYHGSTKEPFTEALESASGFVYESEYQDYCKAIGVQPEDSGGQTDETKKPHLAVPSHEREDR